MKKIVFFILFYFLEFMGSLADVNSLCQSHNCDKCRLGFFQGPYIPPEPSHYTVCTGPIPPTPLKKERGKKREKEKKKKKKKRERKKEEERTNLTIIPINHCINYHCACFIWGMLAHPSGANLPSRANLPHGKGTNFSAPTQTYLFLEMTVTTATG